MSVPIEMLPPHTTKGLYLSGTFAGMRTSRTVAGTSGSGSAVPALVDGIGRLQKSQALGAGREKQKSHYVQGNLREEHSS